MADRTIVYPDADPGTEAFFEGALEQRLERLGRFSLHVGAPASEAEFLARIGDAEAVLLGWAMPDGVLAAAPNLRVVAEHTMALMLAVARRIPELDRNMKAGGWSRGPGGADLAGRRLGLVGLGGIGTRVAALGRAFGMEVVAWTANPAPGRASRAGVTFEPLEAVIAGGDVVSLHLALTPETEGILSAGRLALMKPGAILVNTARGELVDEAALLEALRSTRISAGLDVFGEEPLPEDHPIRRLENVVLTPHSGFDTPGAKRRIFDLAVSALEAFYSGKPINVVNA